MTKYEQRKIKVISHTLKRAAGRANPWPIGVDTDYVIKIGEKQGWCCALTGDKLSFTPGVRRKNPKICTIDRINSKKGYIPGNIQLTTWYANEFKRNYSNTKMFNMCKKILKHGAKI